jgi:REP element-mobilizing transposase RayT
MSTGYQVYNQDGTYFLTCTVVDWVDIFSRKRYRDIVLDSLLFCVREKGLLLYGYVIMTNHIHLLVRSSSGRLSDTVRDFKKFTSYQILKCVQEEPESCREWLLHRFAWNAAQHKRNEAYQVWTHDNHAIEINSDKFFRQKLDYIHQNPVRAGWVEREEDYIYSSAKAILEGNYQSACLTSWID